MEKYLPIGTICTIDSTNRKYAIAGYFSLEYNSSVKMYDYIGIPYPEGLLLHNKVLSFNHEDILKVDFLGYSNESYELFNRKITEQTTEVDSLNQDNDLHYNFTFDENGVVIYEYQTEAENEKNNLNKFLKPDSLENPFNKKYDFSNRTEESENSWSIFEKYEFDENGNVVSEELIDQQEPEYETDNQTEEEYEFDENGVLVSNGE